MFSCLGIITARKGSKGIPSKNRKKLNGKPLIGYTCEVAKKCKFLTDVITTTDCKVISKISRKFGVQSPFIRPKHLSSDTAQQEDAILHAMNWYVKEKKRSFDFVCLLEPTSPFRKLTTLNNAFKILKNNKKLDGISSITKDDLIPQLLKRKKKNNLMGHWLNFNYDNRQAYPVHYKSVGSVIIIRWSHFLKKKHLISKNSYSLEVDQIEGLDLDEPLDFFYAEQLMKHKIYSPDKLKKIIKK